MRNRQNCRPRGFLKILHTPTDLPSKIYSSYIISEQARYSLSRGILAWGNTTKLKLNTTEVEKQHICKYLYRLIAYQI